MACLKASLALVVTLLLVSAPALAEEEYGDDYDDDDYYGEEYGDDYDDDDYYGEEYGDEYGGEGDDYGDDYEYDDELPPFGVEGIIHIPGVLDLDRFTFSKVIDGSYTAMVLYYYEDPEGNSDKALREYEALANEVAEYQDLILAKVHGAIEEDLLDDMLDNTSLFSLPGLVFFPKGSAEPVVYEGAMTADDIAEHLVDLVGEAGMLKELAPLVAKFMSDKGARQETVKEAQAVIEKPLDPANESWSSGSWRRF